jgi:hypothetical protein
LLVFLEEVAEEEFAIGLRHAKLEEQRASRGGD